MKILFLVTEDWYFVSHRLGFAKRLVAEGYEVGLAARESDCREEIEGAGIKFIPIPFARERLDPVAIVRSVLAVRQTVKRERPDIVHLVALRAILIGWMSTLGLRKPPFVYAVTGLGSLFSPWRTTLRLRVVKTVVERLLRLAFQQRMATTVWQNSDDMESFCERGIAPANRARLIRGAGVDFSDRASCPPQPNNPVPVVLFVGRFLREKGVGYLVEASNILQAKGQRHVLRLVGSPDDCNPLSFSSSDVNRWTEEGQIEYLGRRSDIDEQMRSADIIVLPTYYREGLPKVLLEAGRAGRAVVTTDIPGCRDLVVHGKNGFLVAPREVVPLQEAIEKLLLDQALRERMGIVNFNRTRAEFSEEEVFGQFRKLYLELLAKS